MSDTAYTETFDREYLVPGARVEIRNRYLGTWCRGFCVVAIMDDGYLIRRVSDGVVLPTCFSATDIRSALSSPMRSQAGRQRCGYDT